MQHAIVSQNEWLAARKALLAKEKDFTRARDQLSEARRALPWVKVDKNYVFEGPNGRETLSDLFGSKSQLIVYHFMLGPGWVQGCCRPSCRSCWRIKILQESKGIWSGCEQTLGAFCGCCPDVPDIV